MELREANTKVIVADDHGVVRAGISRWLDHEETIEVVGEASSGAEALRMVALYRPDVVLSDIRMPDMSGLELVQVLRERHPRIKSILMTSYKGWHTREVLEMGGVGYLTKEAEREMFVLAVRWAAQGRCWLDPAELQHEMKREEELRERGLTPLEQRILQCIDDTNDQICTKLGLREANLRKNHLPNIYFKVEVNSRQEAIRWARSRKLVPPVAA